MFTLTSFYAHKLPGTRHVGLVVQKRTLVLAYLAFSYFLFLPLSPPPLALHSPSPLSLPFLPPPLPLPQFRGGAAVHGPKPRSHAIGLQKKVRRLGLRVALSARLAEGKVRRVP